MDTMDGARNRWTPRALSVLRLVTAYLYLQHGTAKLLQLPHLAMFDQLYFMVHAAQGNFFMPAINGGEEAVLYCFIFLFLATAGGGSWSIDARLARK